MIEQIQKLSDSIIYEAPIHWNDVAILPFKLSREIFKDYIGLSDAIKKETFVCKEIDESARVSQIKCINKTRSNVLIIEGEHIIGGKQNRVVNITILVKKNSTVIIPVSCVEEGRWSSLNRKFQDSRNLAFIDLRRNLRKTVNESYKRRKSYESDQSLIWNTVYQKAYCMATPTMTGAMEDIYSFVLPRINFDYAKFRINPDIQGIIVFKKKKVENVEFISNPKVFSEFYHKYINSLYLSYDESKFNVNADYEKLADTFWKKLSEVELQSIEAIGVGQNYIGSIDDLNISLFTYENDLVYFSIL